MIHQAIFPAGAAIGVSELPGTIGISTRLPGDASFSCTCCGKRFEPMPGYEDTRQAFGCAASLSGSMVHGAYGSLIDFETWVLTERAPRTLEDGEICDHCIQDLIDAGAIAPEQAPEMAGWSTHAGADWDIGEFFPEAA